MTRVIRSYIFSFLFLGFLLLPQSAMARSAPESFADLAEKLLPAVVNISTTQTISARDDMPELDFEFPPGSPFEDFFRDFMEKNNGMHRNKKLRKRKFTSLGSGFVIDPKGYIVTNNHVIDGADEINVILQDDTNLKAKLIGHDKKTDLALLKVEPKEDLPYVEFGSSDKVRVGDWILAIGNPFGLGGSVTAGIISARARNINSGPYDDYLQTDAPINRGNSGGPMFNMDGKVIGVNTAIFSPSGGSVGIGFAIPSTMAKNVIEQLKTTGHTRRGWLGVRIQVVTPEIAKSLNLDDAYGALVSSVTKDSPAEKAGFETGDVIIKFNGRKVKEMQRLPRMVAETKVGTEVNIVVVRKGYQKTLKVKLGELKADADEDEEMDDANGKNKQELSKSKEIEELGLSLAPINEKLRDYYELDEKTSGLLVTNISPEGLAIEYGIQEGDVIAEAAQSPVTSVDHIKDLIKKAKKDKKPLLILLDRRGDVRFVALTFEDEK